MTIRPASELLYDSEATLRLVDSALDGLHEPAAPVESLESRMRATLGAVAQATGASPPAMGGEMGLVGLSHLLVRGYAEIVSVLDTLRESRSVLEKTAVDRIQHTHAKIREVTSATESAATSILDGLDRATAMIDELDALDGAEGPAAEVRTRLRDEMFALMGHMQFHDITTQQLNYASSILVETEQRLAQLAAVFDPGAVGLGRRPLPSEPAPVGAAFDPNASTMNAEARQAVADEVFAGKRRD